MRRFVSFLLFLALSLTSCQTRADSTTNFFRRTTWWDRRMDRLESWDRHHHYPIEQTKEVVLTSLIVTGAIVAALLAAQSDDSTSPNKIKKSSK